MNKSIGEYLLGPNRALIADPNRLVMWRMGVLRNSLALLEKSLEQHLIDVNGQQNIESKPTEKNPASNLTIPEKPSTTSTTINPTSYRQPEAQTQEAVNGEIVDFDQARFLREAKLAVEQAQSFSDQVPLHIETEDGGVTIQLRAS